MSHLNKCSIIYAASLLFFLSLLVMVINFSNYQYPGNNYLPPTALEMGMMLILIYTGSLIQWGPHSRLSTIIKDIIILFLVMSLIAFSTNAVQYTPFPCIDEFIINIEQKLYINLKTILSFTHNHPFFNTALWFVYNSLYYQMTYIPILLLITKHRDNVHEYCFLLLFSTLLGFSFYYFFPTIAPANFIESPYFTAEQQATGLKFMQIHNHIQPTTVDGGLISLPSFHVIWGWFCLYLLKPWKIASRLLLMINILLVASCVLLGWHYPMDILGSVTVIILSHAAYRYLSKALDNHHEKISYLIPNTATSRGDSAPKLGLLRSE